MSTFQQLLSKYGPAIGPALLVGYLAVTRQWPQLPAAVTALLASLGISVQVAAAASSADQAAAEARGAAANSLSLQMKVNRLVAIQEASAQK
jgi:hypothetical protein